MSWSMVTLVAPSDEITVNGKVINIRNIDIVKIDVNGGLSFIEKQPPAPLTEESGIFNIVGLDEKVKD
jgi:hypothetical protein